MNLRKATQANKVSWTVVAAAGKQWAAKVFPELPEENKLRHYGIRFSKRLVSMKKTLS